MPELVPETISLLNRNWRSSVSFLVNRLQIIIPITIVLNLAPELPSRYSMIAFTVPTLLAFLQIQAAGAGSQPISPFQIRPVTAMASVVAVFGYYLLFLVQSWLPTPYRSQLRVLMLFLGSFSVASLTSLLLPLTLWKFQFVFYFLLAVPELLPFIKNTYDHCLRCLRRWQLLRRRVAPPGLLPVSIPYR